MNIFFQFHWFTYFYNIFVYLPTYKTQESLRTFFFIFEELDHSKYVSEYMSI